MNSVNKLVAFLQGKKTYILVVLGLLTVLAEHYNKISAPTEQQILWVLGFGTVASVRSALANLIQGPVTVQTPVVVSVDSQATQ